MLFVTATGNLGNDPEMKYTADGKPMLRFNIASNSRERDQSGEWQDRTEWVRCTVMGPRAEALSNILHKGMKVCVLGQLKARPWKTQNDEIRAGLEMFANEIEFLSPRQEGESSRTRQPVDDSQLPF